eukprot:3877848-Amphidinium_carterae.1
MHPADIGPCMKTSWASDRHEAEARPRNNTWALNARGGEDSMHVSQCARKLPFHRLPVAATW